MHGTQLGDDNRGVTPVVGIILMISITVLLAATVGAFVMGMDEESVQQQAPMVAIQFDYVAGSSDVLEVVHDTGGSLDEDQTYVDIQDASCSGGATPDGQYQAADAFGQAQPIAAGMTLTVDADLPTASSDPCPGGQTLDLSKATVTVVWRAADGTQSSTVATWHGPDASF